MKKSLVMILAIAGIVWMCSKESPETEFSGIKIERTSFKGWDGAISISNAEIEIAIVPEIGRIMSFGFNGGENILWNDPDFYGITLTPGEPYTENSRIVWANFGGDKVWPTAETDFAAINGYSWPPDHWFDGGTQTAEILEKGVRITSQVSDYCGARCIREILLNDRGAELTIDQTIEKIKTARMPSVEPIEYTVWNVTQIRSPHFALLNLNPDSRLPNRYSLFQPEAAVNFTVDGDVGIFVPDESRRQKSGADSDYWLAAVVDDVVFGEFFRLQRDADYPDKGLSAEVFTCPRYTELELLSPLTQLSVGESLHHTITWRLSRLPDGTNTAAQKQKAALEWLNSFLEDVR